MSVCRMGQDIPGAEHLDTLIIIWGFFEFLRRVE
jgi:hypothetical protein